MPACPICGSPLKGTEEVCPTCGAALNPIQHLPQGTRLYKGQYTLGKVLGQGGFGITYLGADTRRNQPVAIKELFPEGSTRRSSRVIPPTSLVGPGFTETLQRFEAEARMLANFNHPGIVKVFEVFEENGTAYLVMEFLKGQTLGKRIEQQGKLAVAEVQNIANKLSDALEEVHQVGLLHRDIKPDNIFLTEDGRVVLIDFGSARQFAFGKTVSHTRLVTPGYAPLEQYGTAGKFGPYTDIYALGATLYHALMGVAPPAATDRIQNNAPLKLPPAMPDGLENAVNRALEIRVDHRPQSVAEFRQLLNLNKPAPTPPSPTLGSLSLQVTPSDAQIHIQGPGNFQQDVQGSQDLDGLTPGAYTLEGQASGFQTQKIQVQIRPNGRTQAKLDLPLLPNSNPTPPPNPLPPTGISRAQFPLLLLGVALTVIYLLMGVQPNDLKILLQSADEAFLREYSAVLPSYPELFPLLRALLYTLGFLGLFLGVGVLVVRVFWLLPLIILPALVWFISTDVLLLWEAGVLALGLLGTYLIYDLLERYTLALAVIVGLATAIRWADAAQGELLSLGGLAVGILALCLGGIVRLIRGRRRP